MASKLSSVKKVPWLLVFELARMTHGHVMDRTSPADRRKVMDAVRRSHGDPRKLTKRDRDELRAIAEKLDIKQLAGALSPSLMRHRLRK
jgi:hypothetical protein